MERIMVFRSHWEAGLVPHPNRAGIPIYNSVPLKAALSAVRTSCPHRAPSHGVALDSQSWLSCCNSRSLWVTPVSGRATVRSLQIEY